MASLPPPAETDGIGIYFADVLLRSDRSGDCILWGGSLSDGYGYLTRDGMTVGVHRVAYAWRYGAIPIGKVIDHLCHDPAVCSGVCDHRRCVNPNHLAAVTNEENLSRQGPAYKTHCSQGHRYTPATTGRRPNGSRYCKTCNRLARRDRSKEQRALTVEARAWLVERGLAQPGRGRFNREAVAAWNAAHPDRPLGGAA